jgi:sulfur transfer complex TusBCD TusB component (DsrH family)
VAKKILSIIESAYRATLEEQDDTVVWLMQSTRAAGLDLTVLLRGNAVNYAVDGQDASGLSFGERRQTQPPRIADDVARLAAAGVEVLVLEDDLTTRGLELEDLIAGVKLVSRQEIARLAGAHDQVWHW